jgi:hypothetical protein
MALRAAAILPLAEGAVMADRLRVVAAVVTAVPLVGAASAVLRADRLPAAAASAVLRAALRLPAAAASVVLRAALRLPAATASLKASDPPAASRPPAAP